MWRVVVVMIAVSIVSISSQFKSRIFNNKINMIQNVEDFENKNEIQ